MVMKKFSSVLENNKYNDLADKAKLLFIDVWQDKLDLYNIKIFRLNWQTQYTQITIFLNKRLNTESYNTIYKDFFEYCLENDFKFSFSSATNKETIITLEIDDIDDIIKDLELIKNSDKYNL